MLKIGEINALHGRFEIHYDEKGTNPYRVYRKWFDSGWHRKLIIKYGDLSSCMFWLYDYINRHNEERRPA